MAIVIHIGAGDITRVTVTNVSSNTTIAVNKPTNVGNGDLMVLKLSCNDTLNPSSISLPSYWDGCLINENFAVNGSTSCHTAYYRKQWTTGDATTWNATIGASTLDDESFVFKVTGHDPVNPIDVAAVSQNSTQSVSPISPSITTVTDGAVAIYAVSAKNGSVLTAEDTGNPSGTTLIQSKRSRNASGGVNSGLAYELRPTAGATGTKTWTSYTSTAQYHSAYSFAIRPAAPAASIVDVNGDDIVVSGSNGNIIQTDGFTTTPNSVTIDGYSGTSIVWNGTTEEVTFDFPSYVDGVTHPSPDADHTLVCSTGTESADITIHLDPLDNFDAVTISSAVDDDSTYIGYHYTLSNGDKLVYPIEGGDFSISNNGGVTAVDTGERIVWHWDLSTEVMTRLNLTINEAGVVAVILNNSNIGIGFGIGVSI